MIVAVTVVLDADYEKTSMVCALFHDIDDVRKHTPVEYAVTVPRCVLTLFPRDQTLVD